jgi:hypothetical protein
VVVEVEVDIMVVGEEQVDTEHLLKQQKQEQ